MPIHEILHESEVGKVGYFGVNNIPPGWVAAAGQSVSRVAYSRLFAKYGVTYGAGDGSTTFGLPDLRAEFVRGLDNGRGVDVGRTLGSAQADNFKSHVHTRVLAPQPPGVGDGVPQSSQSGETTRPTSDNAAGGNETRPRNVAMLACIKC